MGVRALTAGWLALLSPLIVSALVRVSVDVDADSELVEQRIDEIEDEREEARDNALEAFAEFPATANGDEPLFAGRNVECKGEGRSLAGFASFSKALQHDACGIVEPESFASLVNAVQTGLETRSPAETVEAYEQVELGGGERLLVNPMAQHASQLIGDDAYGTRMAPAPKFGSRNTAIDMVERYWMALCRDVPFEEYATNELTQKAVEDLNNIGFEEEFGYEVTPENLFRGPYEGCDVGPYVSQFLLRDFKLGNTLISQVMDLPQEGLDYMTDMPSWMAVQNGDVDPTGTDVLTVRRHISTLRDGGQFVHLDDQVPLQSSLYAGAILNNLRDSGVEAADNIPYGPDKEITKSIPVVTLGAADFTAQAATTAATSMKHAWFQKWAVHRRLRPEVYAQRLELFRTGAIGDEEDDVFDDGDFRRLFREGRDVWKKTTVLDYVFDHNAKQNEGSDREGGGTWLLPMAFPEGSPAHPSYPAGHATFAAAGATVIKAFFKDTEFPDPLMVNPDDRDGPLIPYNGPRLTVHGELNKLIANLSLFRDGAGVHFRTDATPSAEPTRVDGTQLDTGGNMLGEKVAASMLRDVKLTYREPAGTFMFDGIKGNAVEV